MSSAMNGNGNESCGNGNRPSSLYDNFLDTTCPSPTKELRFNKSPSPTQAHCLITTVPQNLAAPKIAGKHTPTRNSLRHSRMIVLNRNGQDGSKFLPAIIRYKKLTATLITTFTILGLILCLISVWLVIWAPNTPYQDNPYWSAVPILISGITGHIFLCCCPKKYPCTRLSFWYHSVKFINITTSLVAFVSAFPVLYFGLIHIITLQMITCSPSSDLSNTCMCTSERNFTDIEATFISSSYHYVDMSCLEVMYILFYVLIFYSIINCIAIMLLAAYLVLHWKSRDSYNRFIYAQVQRDDDNVTVYSNRTMSR